MDGSNRHFNHIDLEKTIGVLFLFYGKSSFASTWKNFKQKKL